MQAYFCLHLIFYHKKLEMKKVEKIMKFEVNDVHLNKKLFLITVLLRFSR